MRQEIKNGILEKLLPPGSRLRCAYETGLKGAGIIANEGLGIFFKKFNVYINRNYMQTKLYSQWIEENEDYSQDHIAQAREACRIFKYRPKFSIVFPVFNTEKSFLKSAIESVLAQVYDNWELCAVDGNSARPGVKEMLADYSRRDERIKVTFLPENEGIAGNSNCSLQMATGDFVTFLDHDDELSPLALCEFARMLNADPSIAIIYSDEDKIDTAGNRFDPFFKPDWSPDMLRCCNYVSHLLAVRKDLALSAGGFRKEFEGAQDYDFLLRAVENAKNIRHSNKVLYHWRSHSGSIAANAWSKGYAHENGKKALQEHLWRLGVDAVAEDGKDPFRYRIRYNYKLKPMVSIIIHAGGDVSSLKSSAKSIIANSTYHNYEIIVANTSPEKIDGAVMDDLSSYGRLMKSIERLDNQNMAAVNNLAAKSCEGDVLIFLDADLEIAIPDWIESLMEHALRECVGAVGGLILSDHGIVRHAGLVVGLNGPADCICAGMSLEEVERNPAANLLVNYIRDVSAVSGSCLCIAKNKFLDSGGFDESLGMGGSDVNFCLRILRKGYFNIFTPHSIFIDKDGTTASRDRIPLEAISIVDIGGPFKNGDRTRHKDPYYSENFNYNSTVPVIGVRSHTANIYK